VSACRRFVSTLLHPHAEIASIEYFAAGRQSVAQPIIELEAFGAARNLRRQSLESKETGHDRIISHIGKGS